MVPLPEDIEKMRGKQEGLAFWQRRRRFLLVHWDKFCLEDLVNLSYCYSSVMVYSCRYSPEIMNKLYDLAMEVAHQEQTGSALPLITQEKWDLAMAEHKISGRIVLNVGEDQVGESTESEQEAEEHGDVDQKLSNWEVKGQIKCPVQKGNVTDFQPQATRTVHCYQQDSSKGGLCAGEKTLNLSLLCLSGEYSPSQKHLHPDCYDSPRKYQSPPRILPDPKKSNLKFDEKHTNSLQKPGNPLLKVWQQNKIHTSPAIQRTKINYDSLKSITGSPGVINEKSTSTALLCQPETAQLPAIGQHKLTPKVDTGLFLNKHTMRGETSPLWHPLLQTDVQGKTASKQTVGTRCMNPDIVGKPCHLSGTVPLATRGHQNKPQSKETEGNLAAVQSEKKRTTPTGKQENLGRKGKTVMFKTQAVPEHLNKMSDRRKTKEFTTKRTAGVDGKETSAVVSKASEARQNMRFYTPQRSKSMGSLPNSSLQQDQSRLSENKNVTQRQMEQSKVHNSKSYGNALWRIPSKGVQAQTEASSRGCKNRELLHKEGVPRSYIQEIPRYKPERNCKEAQAKGKTISRVIYPSRVKTQPPVKGLGDHRDKTSHESRSHCKSRDRHGRTNQVRDGQRPSQQQDGEKAGNFCFKTFFQNLLQKARN